MGMPRKEKIESSAEIIRDEERIWDGNQFYGTYVVYPAGPFGSTRPFACDVEISTLEESYHKESRAYRLERNKLGKRVGPLRKESLHHELVVVLGPDMTPKEAVAALQRVIRSIKRDGLWIGRKKDGDFLVETVDGELVDA